mgnify:FL=1
MHIIHKGRIVGVVMHYRVGKTYGLSGEITIQGSKNEALPVIAAAILNKGRTVMRNCPDISDVRIMLKILKHLGCNYKFENNILVLDSDKINVSDIPKEDVTKLRSSIVLAGALLSRNNWCKISYPGGCNIGLRKIDVHIDILRKMGYEIDENEETSELICRGRVNGDKHIRLRIRSVGATENGILAAVLSDGYCLTFSNVSKEPEIINLCKALIKMGADITGAGTDEIVVRGVKSLRDTTIDISCDRIVCGTYLAAVTAVGGEVRLLNVNKNFDKSILNELEKFGMKYKISNDEMWVSKTCKDYKSERDIIISTSAYPGFPTDMQSQMMTLLSRRKGSGIIIENIFENRFGTARMLNKMGADIKIIGDRIALINGVDKLYGEKVEATDLRGGASLIIAGMIAENHTIIENAEFIKRGYESIERDLGKLGADIELMD